MRYIIKGGSYVFSTFALFLSESLCLFGNQICIVKVVDLHGATNFVEGSRCSFASHFTTLAEHFVYGRDVLFKFLASFADRAEFFLHDSSE